MPTSRLFARLAVDANPLLSALIGGAAYRIFRSSAIGEFVTTETVLADVRDYIPILAKKRRLDIGLVGLTLSALPVLVFTPRFFSDHVSEAARRIGRRDPGDVDLLALALKLGSPIWSNDDFATAGVE